MTIETTPFSATKANTQLDPEYYSHYLPKPTMTSVPPTPSNNTSTDDDSSSTSKYFTNPFKEEIIKNLAVEAVLQGVSQKILGSFSASDAIEGLVYSALYEATCRKGAATLIEKTNTKDDSVSDSIEAHILKFLGVSVMDIVVGNMMFGRHEGYTHVFLKNGMTQVGAYAIAKMLEKK